MPLQIRRTFRIGGAILSREKPRRNRRNHKMTMQLVNSNDAFHSLLPLKKVRVVEFVLICCVNVLKAFFNKEASTYFKEFPLCDGEDSEF